MTINAENPGLRDPLVKMRQELAARLLERDKARVEEGQKLAKKTWGESTSVYGIFSHPTGAGGKEYILFKEELGGGKFRHFIITGQNSDDSFQTQDIEIEHPPVNTTIMTTTQYIGVDK
jgi:hypothetical protein